MTDSRPNVLLVSIDSLRADYCSFLNPAERTSPRLDRFAETATTFGRAISPSVWTLPVHTSVFTGLYPPEHGVIDRERALGSHPTFAELLSENGYRATAYSNNSWLETGDILRGFDHRPTELEEGDPRRTLDDLREDLSLRGVSEYVRSNASSLSALARELRFRDVHTMLREDELAISNAIEDLPEDDPDSPFVQFVHLMGVHYPYRPSAPYIRPFGDYSLAELNLNERYQRKYLINNRGHIYAGEHDVSPETSGLLQDMYRGGVLQTDALLAPLFETLQRRGLLSSTVVVVFGDHGDHLCSDGHFGHHFSVGDALIRVPLVIHDPTGTIPSGHVEDVVQLNDLYPTLLNMAGIDPPETESVDISDGRDAAFTYYQAPDSLVERLESEEGISRDRFPPTTQRAVWESPSRKLVSYGDGTTIGDPSLEETLSAHEEAMSADEGVKGDELDPEIERSLRDLGYL